MGARPLELSTCYAVIADWLSVANKTTGDREAPCAPLLQVRDVVVAGSLGPSEIARVLRAVPQLRRFVAHSVEVEADGDPFWFSDTTGRTRSALSGLTHPRLRNIEVGRFVDADDEEEEEACCLPPVDCALRLRRDHFPRLQCLVCEGTDDKEHRYHVTLPERTQYRAVL
jgi:hypothetical protein